MSGGGEEELKKPKEVTIGSDLIVCSLYTTTSRAYHDVCSATHLVQSDYIPAILICRGLCSSSSSTDADGQSGIARTIVLLGTGGTGKSTLFRQLVTIYGQGFSESIAFFLGTFS